MKLYKFSAPFEKLIKKMRLSVPCKNDEMIQEYEDDYICLVNRQIKRALEKKNSKSRNDEFRRHLRYRKMKCEKCGVWSIDYLRLRFFGEEKNFKTYCFSCYKERTGSGLQPAVCWIDEFSDIAVIGSKSTHRNEQ
jgi:hypothetical protein